MKNCTEATVHWQGMLARTQLRLFISAVSTLTIESAQHLIVAMFTPIAMMKAPCLLLCLSLPFALSRLGDQVEGGIESDVSFAANETHYMAKNEVRAHPYPCLLLKPKFNHLLILSLLFLFRRFNYTIQMRILSST
jgi:hypothetical protein